MTDHLLDSLDALDPADGSGTERWFRVGRSTLTDAAQAGAQAAAAAIAGGTPSLLTVFCSTGYDVEALLAGVCSVTPDSTRIVGGTTFGEIAAPSAGLPDLGWRPGVVVSALGGDGFMVDSVVVSGASADRRACGAAAAAVMASIEAPHRVLMMLVDGLTREQHELVRGAYGVLGLEVPIVGGCSADNLEYVLTHQFHGTGAQVEALVDSVVAIALGSTAPIGIGIAHGWAKQGEPMVVTRSEGGHVFMLDGEPALEAYLRRIGASRALLEDIQKFRETAFENPLGMSRRSAEDIRVVHDIDVERGSLICLADVPEGALVWTMTTDTESLLAAASQSCQLAMAGLEGRSPLGLVVFDCGARKVMLGAEHLPTEQAALAEAAGGAPMTGFYTLGEIGRTHGSRGMHHLTVVTLALA